MHKTQTNKNMKANLPFKSIRQHTLYRLEHMFERLYSFRREKQVQHSSLKNLLYRYHFDLLWIFDSWRRGRWNCRCFRQIVWMYFLCMWCSSGRIFFRHWRMELGYLSMNVVYTVVFFRDAVIVFYDSLHV